jgi:restriction system protein
MAIPKYDEMMLPLLRFLDDGAEHAARELADRIAIHFKLTPEECAKMLPKVRATYVRHRVGWAIFSLRRAGLAEHPRRGIVCISDEGRKFLAGNPSQLRAADLKAFPAFVAFISRMKSDSDKGDVKADTAELVQQETPEERIESAFNELNATLVTEILSRLAKIDPFRFEQVVLDLLVKMGYGGSFKEAAAVTQKTGDEGIDGVINQDRLGLDVIYVQAKRWKANVGRQEIQGFVGALAGKKASKGVFITTSSFNDNASAYATGLHQKVILIDGPRLAELMIEHGIGVDEEQAYRVKKIDSDYFDEA